MYENMTNPEYVKTKQAPQKSRDEMAVKIMISFLFFFIG